jgi:hypothetical protein
MLHCVLGRVFESTRFDGRRVEMRFGTRIRIYVFVGAASKRGWDDDSSLRFDRRQMVRGRRIRAPDTKLTHDLLPISTGCSILKQTISNHAF